MNLPQLTSSTHTVDGYVIMAGHTSILVSTMEQESVILPSEKIKRKEWEKKNMR